MGGGGEQELSYNRRDDNGNNETGRLGGVFGWQEVSYNRRDDNGIDAVFQIMGWEVSRGSD